MAEKEKVKTESPKGNKSIQETIKLLREEIGTNKALNAMCQIFSQRQRARAQVTVGALKQTMYKEGFNFSVAEYEKALRFLASIGIGKIMLDRSGKIHSLKDIKITLQSIGLAAISKQDNFESQINQTKFVNLPMERTQKPKVQGAFPSSDSQPFHSESSEQGYPASLSVIIEGKTVNFPLPRKITTKELGEFLSQDFLKK